MKRATIGIIGGTGLGDTLMQKAGGTPAEVTTPFGSPSAPPILANWEGVDVAFIARHGQGHQLNPSSVPYRANIFALKKLGVSAIIASGATGSLREDIVPGHLVICDQVIDKTNRRANTFYERGLVVHVAFADPFCPTLRDVLIRASARVSTTVHHSGTYVCMEGPQFSTRSESNMHRQWGGDLIGMTCMPEAKLAREAEICYALVALPTDYDCWRPVRRGREKDELLSEIMRNLKKAGDNAVALIHETLAMMDGPPPACACQNALEMAIWSDRDRVDPAIRDRLQPLIGHHFADH